MLFPAGSTQLFSQMWKERVFLCEKFSLGAHSSPLPAPSPRKCAEGLEILEQCGVCIIHTCIYKMYVCIHIILKAKLPRLYPIPPNYHQDTGEQGEGPREDDFPCYSLAAFKKQKLLLS